MTRPATVIIVARIPAALAPHRPAIAYGLYLARRHRNWEAAAAYPKEACKNTRIELDAAAFAELEQLEASSGQPRYTIITTALHNAARDRLSPTAGLGPEGGPDAAAEPSPNERAG